MTEKAWLAATNATSLLRVVKVRIPRAFGLLDPRSFPTRKLSLFNTACCRQVWEQLSDPTKNTVRVVEQIVEGSATSPAPDPTPTATGSVGIYERGIVVGLAYKLGSKLFADAIEAAAAVAQCCAQVGLQTSRKVFSDQVALVRDIFRNPFCPVAVESSWLTSTVVVLAEGIYQERAFDRLPILADALMDAGCDNDDVLNHCRSDGPHVRGCWVIDLLTGRA